MRPGDRNAAKWLTLLAVLYVLWFVVGSAYALLVAAVIRALGV